jgi:hypothetical protein
LQGLINPGSYSVAFSRNSTGSQSHVTVRVPPKRRHSASVIALALASSPPHSTLYAATHGGLATPSLARSLLYTRLEKSNHPDHHPNSVPLFRFKSVQTTKLTSNYSVSSEVCSIRHPALVLLLSSVICSAILLGLRGFDLNRSECPSDHLGSDVLA